MARTSLNLLIAAIVVYKAAAWSGGGVGGPRFEIDRRKAIAKAVSLASSLAITQSQPAAFAYTPDSDTLRESLYLISRAQEATVQQERLANKPGLTQEFLQTKMKLSLKLVDRSYRLLDQINYCSQFVDPPSKVVVATEAGFEAVDALQSAIDYVNLNLTKEPEPLTEAQRLFLTDAMITTRTGLFTFVEYMPQGTLKEARLRIEQENVDNAGEFDGDSDAGVYHPVKLPWK